MKVRLSNIPFLRFYQRYFCAWRQILIICAILLPEPSVHETGDSALDVVLCTKLTHECNSLKSRLKTPLLASQSIGIYHFLDFAKLFLAQLFTKQSNYEFSTLFFHCLVSFCNNLIGPYMEWTSELFLYLWYFFTHLYVSSSDR